MIIIIIIIYCSLDRKRTWGKIKYGKTRLHYDFKESNYLYIGLYNDYIMISVDSFVWI